MKKRDLDELFEEFYKDENEMLMNLFCASLISSECLENEQDCLMHMEKLQAFKKFIEQQPDSEKKRSMLRNPAGI